MKKMINISIYLILTILLIQPSIQNVNGLVGSRLKEGVSDLHIAEGITFESHYQTSADYSKWQISNNKAIEIKLSVINNPLNKIILVNYMYAVIYVESRQQYYDDIEQDHMDDYNTGVEQSGFFINGTYSYMETFSVMGMNTEFLEMLRAGICRDPDSNYPEITSRYTEDDMLGRFSICGQTLYVVYDLMIKLPGEEFYHKLAISDNIYIDTNGTVVVNQSDMIDQLTENTVKDVPGYDMYIVIGISSISVIIIFKKYHK